jgi:leucyl-tRNA synthetase
VPETVADVYGVDVVRMYLMFMGPFDSTMAWNEKTLMGVKRFLDRFEKYVKCQIKEGIASGEEVKLIINKLIKGVTDDLENFKYNTAVAKMMEALNSLSSYKVDGKDIEMLIKLLAPFAPYIAEELWNKLGNEGSVHVAEWPVVDEKYLVDDEIVIMVAINGKVRDKISVDRSQISNDKKLIEQAKSLGSIQRWIGDKKIVKEIYVEGKMINFAILD